VHLTNEGASLLPRVQQALAELERAVDDVRLDRLAGPLRVTTLTSFLQLWLLPRIARFRTAHPEVDLHIHTSVDQVDFVHENFHLGIRLGVGDWPNLKAEKLLDEWLVPVCSPALYAKHGPLRTADDLKRYPLVHSVSEPWTDWLFDSRAEHYAGEFRGSVFEDSQAVAHMAVLGAGLALGRWSLVADDIHCGALVAAGRPVQYGRGYWLVCPSRAEGLQSVRAFLDWIRGEALLFTTTRTP
jgi:LysR family glycine cleavage system transcriptional activator